MSEPEPLDHELASRLRAAAELEAYPALDDAARARVLEALHGERPSKHGTRALWLAGLAAAAAALALGLVSSRSPQAAPCALPTDVRFSRQGALDLGAYGRVVLAPGAQASVTRAESCMLELTLHTGRLAAALHDLRPALLSVRTPLGAVEVHGTTFSVQVDGGLEVVLLEGAVELLEDGVAPVPLAPGRVLTRSDKASQPRITNADAAQTRRVQELLSPAPKPKPTPTPTPTPQPAPPAPAATAAPEPAPAEQPAEVADGQRNATALLEAAERERRAGKSHAARALYRQASAQPGGDAEVALLRWARLELTEQRARAAARVLSRYRSRYDERAQLGAEASFLELQTLSALGQHERAQAKAAELIQRYPDSPHARAAAAWKP